MVPDRIIEQIAKYAEQVTDEVGLELVEVQFRRESHGWVLRILIDSDQGITVDDCAKISREVSAFLDVEDLIEHAYHLEVSSPGLNRPLRTQRDYERLQGREVKITLKDAVDAGNVVRGIIETCEDDVLTIVTQHDRKKIHLDNIAKGRLVF